MRAGFFTSLPSNSFSFEHHRLCVLQIDFNFSESARFDVSRQLSGLSAHPTCFTTRRALSGRLLDGSRIRLTDNVYLPDMFQPFAVWLLDSMVYIFCEFFLMVLMKCTVALKFCSSIGPLHRMSLHLFALESTRLMFLLLMKFGRSIAWATYYRVL